MVWSSLQPPEAPRSSRLSQLPVPLPGQQSRQWESLSPPPLPPSCHSASCARKPTHPWVITVTGKDWAPEVLETDPGPRDWGFLIIEKGAHTVGQGDPNSKQGREWERLLLSRRIPISPSPRRTVSLFFIYNLPTQRDGQKIFKSGLHFFPFITETAIKSQEIKTRKIVSISYKLHPSACRQGHMTFKCSDAEGLG